jgi:hypothetical protein
MIIDKPKKKIIIRKSANFYFDNARKEVSLLLFLDWCKKALTKGVEDVVLSVKEEYSELDGEYVSSSLILSWDEKIKNKNYDKQLAKWKKQNGKS